MLVILLSIHIVESCLINTIIFYYILFYSTKKTPFSPSNGFRGLLCPTCRSHCPWKSQVITLIKSRYLEISGTSQPAAMASKLAGTAAVSRRRGSPDVFASPSKAWRSSLSRFTQEARSSAPLWINEKIDLNPNSTILQRGCLFVCLSVRR